MDQLRACALPKVKHARETWNFVAVEVISDAREAYSKRKETWEVGMEEPPPTSQQAAAS
jgi:hypothetical protein